MSEARIWHDRHMDQPTFPDDCRNIIVLSTEFFQGIIDNPIPTDLESVKAL